ncbi:MAG: hypothetical protein ACKVS9_17205 [Phycisphaerae bacterium]
MIDPNTPWHALATTHNAFSMLIGVGGGMLLQALLNDLFERRSERRARAREAFEDYIDEVVWVQTSALRYESTLREATHQARPPAARPDLTIVNA